MMKIDEFKKFDFRIGKVAEATEKCIRISCGDGVFFSKLKLNVSIGDKIVVVVNNGKLTIPLINGSVLIIPEKDIEEGTKIS